MICFYVSLVGIHLQSVFHEVNPAEMRHKCHKCEKSYKQKCTLFRHLRYECGIERKFECDICNKKFSQKSTLKYHIKCVHEKFI